MGIAFAITTSGVFIMKINLFYSKKLYHIAYLSIPLCTNIGPLRRYFWEKRDVLYITQFFCISFVMLPDCKPTYDDHTQYEFEIDWIIPRIKIRDEGFLFVCSRGAYCIFFSCVNQKLFKRTLVIWTRKTLSWKRITLKRDWYMKGVFLLWMKCGSKLLQFRTLSGMYHFFIKKKNMHTLHAVKGDYNSITILIKLYNIRKTKSNWMIIDFVYKISVGFLISHVS